MAGDAFEAAEMHDGAPIVRRDKVVSRGMAALLAGSGLLPFAVAILVALVNGSSERPLPAPALPFFVAFFCALGVLMMGMGVVFGVLRTVVTKKAVHVKYGLWGPTIALDAIESVRVVDYDWTEFGGWGIRIGKGGKRAYVPRNGPCLELVYRDGPTRKHVLIGAENAAATAAAIEEARARPRITTDLTPDPAAVDEEPAAVDEEPAAEPPLENRHTR
ncbi:MAG: hypothetical protein KIT84_06560 [Labilithrix sp.]|nr:hypothetical protein [Labilithrix sp.]